MVMLSTRIDHLERSAKRHRGEYLNRHLTVSCQPSPEDKLSLSHWQYKYKFTPPPPRWDPVIRHIKLIIRELNREYIGFASLHVRVYPTNDSGPFWPIHPRFPLYDGKLYTFVLDDGEEFPMSAIVRLHDDLRHLEELDVEHLWIKVGDRWLNLKSWLRIKRRDESELVGKLGLDALRKWWTLNGKAFRLFYLPLELGHIIYEFALGSEFHPLPICDDQGEVKNVVLGAGYSREVVESNAYREMGFDKAIPEGRTFVPKPNLALLQTCSQVHNSALPIGWTASVKCFDDKQLFLTLAYSHISPRIHSDWFNKIQLNLTFKQWFDFFGVSASPVITIGPTQSSADSLNLNFMPNLKHLELRFRNPHDGGNGNPWDGRLDAARYLDCCQRDMVDMVCTFAFPHVTWIPNIKLVGYVEDASKAEWQRS